jgi:flagellar biosynthetic protein FliO
MVALALALVAALSQDEVVGPVLPPELHLSVAPAQESVPASEAPPPPKAAEKLVPPPDVKPAPQKLVDRPDSGPSLGGFFGGSLVVLALLVGTFVLLKRYGRGSRFLAGGGVISVLARKALGQRQEVYLVEVGTKVFLIGSTKEHLTTLGEFANPDEVAVLRANLPGRPNDSMKVAFRESLREGLRDEEEPVPVTRVYDSIAGELAEIKKTVRAWRA